MRLLPLTGLLVFILAFLPPQTSLAQLADDFTVDGSLNPSLWTNSTSLVTSLAAEFNSSLILPTLSFSAAGMNVSGVNAFNELAGLQSLALFQPPFTFSTAVTAGQAHGNAYEVFLESADLTQWINVAGNLNPGNGSFFGVWVNYDNSGLPFLSLGHKLYSDPSTNAEYTIQMFIDNNGSATVSLFASNGTALGVLYNMNVGTGPFHLILGQREGGPSVAGPNVATWKYASMTPLAPAPVLAPITGSNGSLTLAWNTVAGATYQAQYSNALAPAQWNNVGSPITAAGSQATVVDAPGADVARFYRVVVFP